MYFRKALPWSFSHASAIFLNVLSFPSLEIASVQILGQPIKNMIQTIEDCR